MGDKHIISIIESAPLASLKEGEKAIIRAHIVHCAECRRAYEAAQISSMLLKERARETVEPSPFFQTRLLAALREQQAAQETFILQRMWKTAGAMVSSMVVMVAVMVVLTFFVPTPTPQPPQDTASSTEYDIVLVQDNPSDDEMSYDDVFTMLYEPEEEEAK